MLVVSPTGVEKASEITSEILSPFNVFRKAIKSSLSFSVNPRGVIRGDCVTFG